MIAYKGFHTSLRFSWLISLAMGTTKNERTSLDYPRVTSFDALKQLTDICAHRITLSGRKFIILNKLSCFQSKHTFWENIFLFKISLSTS